MGYPVRTVEVNFTVPDDNVPAALTALNLLFKGEYTTLTEVLERNTHFYDCTENDTGFTLGRYNERWQSDTESAIVALGTFADEGSYVRFRGEDDDALFGYRVVKTGSLREEEGKEEITWTLIPLDK